MQENADVAQIDISNKNLYKHSLFSVIFKFMGMLLSLISSPLILDCLGTERYGIWVSLLGIVSWIYYFDLGIGGGLQNKLASALALDDIEKAKNLIGVSYFILFVISFVVFLIGAVVFRIVDIATIFNYKISESIPKILTTALLFACINFVAQLINNILYAEQKAGLVGGFNLIAQVIMIVFLVVYRITGIKSLLLVAVAQGISNLFKNIIASLFVRIKYPQLKISFANIKFSYAKEISSFGLQLFVINIAALVLNTTDNLLISKFWGAAEVTPYHFCYTFFSIIQVVFVAVNTPFFAGYTVAYARKDKIWLAKTLRKTLLLWLIFAFGSIVAVFLFKPFAAFWLRKELFYQDGLVVLCAIFFILLMLGHITTSIVNATCNTKYIIIPVLLQAVLNIPFSIFFAKTMSMGVNGIVLGSIASLMLEVVVAAVVTKTIIKNME